METPLPTQKILCVDNEVSTSLAKNVAGFYVHGECPDNSPILKTRGLGCFTPSAPLYFRIGEFIFGHACSLT